MTVLKRLAIKIGSVEWMPRYLPQIVKCDNFLQKATGGRYGLLDLATLPSMTLMIAGRKSGVVRTTRLLCVPSGERWLVAGSYFGGPRTPAWVYNIRAADEFGVVYKGREFTGRARELENADRAKAWQELRAEWPNFDLYEQRTNRRIPVFEIRRR